MKGLVNKRSRYVIMMCIALIMYSCTDDDRLLVDQITLGKLVNDSTMVLRGALFSDTSIYLYRFHEKKGLHELYEYKSEESSYRSVFEYEAGVGSRPAKFIDCNFDTVKDLVITIESGGNYNAEINTIFLKQNNSFHEVQRDLSYPIFDFAEKNVLSRYQGPNDNVITIETFQWSKDSLILIKTHTIKEEKYIMDYGSLIPN